MFIFNGKIVLSLSWTFSIVLVVNKIRDKSKIWLLSDGITRYWYEFFYPNLLPFATQKKSVILFVGIIQLDFYLHLYPTYILNVDSETSQKKNKYCKWLSIRITGLNENECVYVINYDWLGKHVSIGANLFFMISKVYFSSLVLFSPHSLNL